MARTGRGYPIQPRKILPVKPIPTAYTSNLSGSVGFAGSQSSNWKIKALIATLSFVGTQSYKWPVKALNATLSFTGSQAKSSARSFTAGLSFVGSQVRARGKLFTGALSFTGSQARANRKAVNGNLFMYGASNFYSTVAGTAPVAWWKLNEKGGLTAADSAGSYTATVG